MTKLLTTGTLASDVCRYMLLGRTFRLEQESDVKLIEEQAPQTEGHKGLVVGGQNPWYVHLVLEDKSQVKQLSLSELKVGKFYSLSRFPDEDGAIVFKSYISNDEDSAQLISIYGVLFSATPSMTFYEVKPTWQLA